MRNALHAKVATKYAHLHGRQKAFLQFNTPRGFSGPICYEHLGVPCTCMFKVDIGKVLSIKAIYESGHKGYEGILERSAGSVLYSLDPDRVQSSMEKMVPELESYRRFDVFTEEEINDIVETRRIHEYRLQRCSKQLVDYLRYIQYEMDLEQRKDAIKKEKFIGATHHVFETSHRIVSLFRAALQKFPQDKALFVQFVEYAMSRKHYDDLKLFFGGYCLRNMRDVDLWIFCAGKLLEMGDADSARVMMQKGIRANPGSPKIKLEYFRLEVLHMEEMLRLREEPDILCPAAADEDEDAIPFLVFCDLYKKHPKCSEVSEALSIASRFEGLSGKIRCLLEKGEAGSSAGTA
ncbi:UNVERIFIED_CONTAM: hypothetical protein PYX00_011623 [Menopon gallinae]|uniref:U3 small nucleolar RNA-associated protein 6 N-terminal domain-containing protein n=1 Tax=Menopon gallinae TaxID=328185 RepID=A0AAW2H863_9NEOP